MKHEFPDAMRTSDGMAGRLLRGKAGQQLEDRGPMPRLALKRSPELLLQSVGFRSHPLHRSPHTSRKKRIEIRGFRSQGRLAKCSGHEVTTPPVGSRRGARLNATAL